MKPYSSQIWRISTSNWHRAQLAIVDKPYLQGTQRSPLTSQLLCVWLAVSNAHFPVLSRKPSESVKTKISTSHFSKTKTNFSKIPSKLFSGLQNLVIEINLSRRFSWPLKSSCLKSGARVGSHDPFFRNNSFSGIVSAHRILICMTNFFEFE